MKRSHVLILSVLPIVLNNVLTPIAIAGFVGFREFVKNPAYYIFLYGPYLWSVYEIFLAYLALVFLRREGGDVKRVIGGFRDRPLLSIAIVIGFTALSMSLNYVSSLMFGAGTSSNLIKMLPLFTVLYLATVGSIIAGICEEFIWRGYLLTRFETLTGKKVVAVVIQAILFGLYHGPYAISPVVFGLIAGLIYIKTRRLTPLMIGHTIINSIGFTIAYLT